MASLPKAHAGSHDGVDVLGDHVEELREVNDEDVHRPVLKLARRLFQPILGS